MECTSTVSIGGTEVFVANGFQTTWVQDSGSYAANGTTAAASVDLDISVTCAGTPDASGQYVFDIDDVVITGSG